MRGRRVRKKYLFIVLRILLIDFNKAVQDKNKDKFIEIIQWTKEYFWKETTSFGQNYTDKIIYLMTEQVKKINENLWKTIKLKNIYDWTVIEWVIVGISDNFIEFENWEKIDINQHVLE